MRTPFLLLLSLLAGCGASPDAAATDAAPAETSLSDVGADTAPSDGGSDGSPVDSVNADDADAPTFEQVFAALSTSSCSSGYCHGGGAGGWSWGSAQQVYDQWVGVASKSCAGLKRVVPGKPDDSAVHLKVHGSFGARCSGDPMPPGTPLTATQRSLVERWIAGGAKR